MRLTALTLTALFASAIAQAQTEKILYSFSGPDGSTPVADLVMDKAGNLYGTTQWGGSQGFGTVFELSPGQGGTWTENVLYSFCGNNGCTAGSEPMAGLVLDSNGNLYGTTYTGGRQGCPELTTGCGVVFELSPPARPGDAWTESVLYTFCSDDEGNRCLDGGRPVAKLTFDAAGNLYGTTSDGGAQDYGAAFELSPGPSGWTEEVLYSFCAGGQFPVCPDGSEPVAGVSFDKAGNLYGTTLLGGSPQHEGNGVVYKLSPGQSGWQETVLYVPVKNQTGYQLAASVTLDAAGNLYTTSEYGAQNGVGAVFQMNQARGKLAKFSFNEQNGAYPVAGVLVDSRNGAVYGTTQGGGTAGTVFKVTTHGGTVLHNFTGQPDGAQPMAGLIADHSGNLYGTTSKGGTSNNGTVFEIIP